MGKRTTISKAQGHPRDAGKVGFAGTAVGACGRLLFGCLFEQEGDLGETVIKLGLGFSSCTCLFAGEPFGSASAW